MRTLILGLIAALAVGITDKETTYGAARDVLNWIWITQVGREEMTLSELSVYQRLRFRVWNDLCFEYRADVSCIGIHVPKIAKFRPNPMRPGLAGYYDGGDTVYLRSTLKGYAREEVLAHEMSHYLDEQLDMTVIPGPAKQICFSEKRAWAVSDAFWTKKFGPNSREIVGATWVNWYTHCTPYKSELYPNVYKD